MQNSKPYLPVYHLFFLQEEFPLKSMGQDQRGTGDVAVLVLSLPWLVYNH